MNYKLTWMAQALVDAGLNVREIGGWRTRGHGDVSDIRGVLLHHTAGPASGNFPSENVVVNGRPGLAGPLANLGLARDGTWIVVAAGLAYHAGAGYISWCGRDNGNNHLIGIEAENTGVGEPWPQVQLRSYIRGTAALLRAAGLPASRAIAHREWTPRKIDPTGIDMGSFRAAVQAELEDDMPSAQEVADTLLATPVTMPNGDLVPVRELLKWTNVAAWEGRDRSAWMALGKPGGWFDGGGGEEGSTDSGGAQIRALIQDVDEIKAMLAEALGRTA